MTDAKRLYFIGICHGIVFGTIIGVILDYLIIK